MTIVIKVYILITPYNYPYLFFFWLHRTALYIGAVVGGVVCVILIIGIVICCVYKGKTPVRRHRHVNNGKLYYTHI